MRKTALTILVGLGLGATVEAASEIRGGAFAGANLATVRIEGAPADLELTKRTSFAVGAILAWRPSEPWTIELRPSYVGGGAQVLIAGADTEIKTAYVELPILVTLEVGHGRVRPYALAGAAIGYRTSATAVSPSGEEDIADDFESTDTSLRLGMGVRFRATPSEPFVEVEYSWGLNDLNAQATGLGTGLGAIRNRGLQIRAGFAFRLGKK